MTGRLSPRAFDVGLTAAIFVVAVGETLIVVGDAGSRWLSAALTGAMCLVLLWRRRHPVAMPALAVVFALLQAAFLEDPTERIATFFPLLVLAYGAGAYAELRAALVALGTIIAGAVGMELAVADSTAADFLFPIGIVTLCWLGGRIVRTWMRLAAELHESAALAAEQRERDAQQAVAEERRRIAREMHDVVAHSISIMVVQAGGARRILASDRERAAEAARRIRQAGADALAEMDTLLGVLDESFAAPTLDGLPALVEQAEHAGLPVELALEGTPRLLPAGAELAAYRVVQEALTNAIKHAGGATTSVQVRWSDAALELHVADRGDGGPVPRLAGAGHGLMGMRERVRPYGGEVHSGPRAGGGFEVVARIPLEQEPAGVG